MARDVWFRWNRKNLYSIAALMPLIEGARLTGKPRPGVMLYSFATAQAEEVYHEVAHAGVDAVYIAGGPHPSARPEEALELFDYVVLGEGEETLPELILALDRGTGPDGPEGVAGIAFKRRGQVMYTCRRGQVDLDRYPPFRRPLLAPVEISRGCPWGCAYCQTPRLFGTRMRHRSVQVIVSHAREHKDIRFTSPNSLAYGSDGRTPRLESVELLLRSLSELGRPIYFGTFPSEVRPEFVSERALELITAYCANETLNIGGQSGSERVLRSIRRGHGLAEVEAACEMCLDHGIKPHVDLIFGLPGESPEDQNLTLDLARWIVNKGGKVRAHYFEPLPGTPLEGRMPAPLEEDVDKELGRLALVGSLTGKWSPRGRTA